MPMLLPMLLLLAMLLPLLLLPMPMPFSAALLPPWLFTKPIAVELFIMSEREFVATKKKKFLKILYTYSHAHIHTE